MKFLIFTFFWSLCVLLAKGELEYDGKAQIHLEHALEDSEKPVYKFRGEVSIRSLHSGASFIEQAQLSAKDLIQLTETARAGGKYILRATVMAADKKTIFYTSTSACALLESRLNDMLYINLDHVGNVIGVSVTSISSCTEAVTARDLANFNTLVFVRHMELGPVPDTASYIQKLEREREAKDRGEVKDNRSFLAKYWMYIVPVVIFVLISSASNPEGGGQ